MAEENKNKGKKIAVFVVGTVITFLLLWYFLKPATEGEERMAGEGEGDGGGGGGGGSYPDVPTGFELGGVKTLPATYRQPTQPTVTRSSAVTVSAQQPLTVKGYTPKVQIPQQTAGTTTGGGSGLQGALTGSGVSIGLTTGHTTTNQMSAGGTGAGGKNIGMLASASSLNLSSGGSILVK